MPSRKCRSEIIHSTAELIFLLFIKSFLQRETGTICKHGSKASMKNRMRFRLRLQFLLLRGILGEWYGVNFFVFGRCGMMGELITVKHHP